MTPLSDEDHRINYMVDVVGMGVTQARQHVQSHRPSPDEAFYVLGERCRELRESVLDELNRLLR